MANKQKQRGKYFENKVAKILIENIEEFNEDNVHRSVASGTFHTEYGDIYFKDNKFNMIIECKYRKQWDLINFIKWNSPISDYWTQLQHDTEKYKEHHNPEYVFPMLVVSKPYYDIFAITNIDILNTFNIDIKDFDFIIINNKQNKILVYLDELIKKIK